MRPLYLPCQLLARHIRWMCLRAEVVRGGAAGRAGGYVLACSHLSHLEPFCVGAVVWRKIDWVSRIEFYRRRVTAFVLDQLDCIPVNRQGVPVSTIRTAVARAREGRAIGIFPEGGVTTGADSVCRGGAIKQGACVIAYRANVPVVPCVVLGTHTLNRVRPWLPFRRGRVYLAFGEPLYPNLDLSPRAARRELAGRVQASFVQLYRELRDAYSIPDSDIP